MRLRRGHPFQRRLRHDTLAPLASAALGASGAWPDAPAASGPPTTRLTNALAAPLRAYTDRFPIGVDHPPAFP